jgi:hypothetical protein
MGEVIQKFLNENKKIADNNMVRPATPHPVIQVTSGGANLSDFWCLSASPARKRSQPTEVGR